tara:strand:- start:268 stop:660 length:393 start_codon:yes stop_codon:yes gene_type:complete
MNRQPRRDSWVVQNLNTTTVSEIDCIQLLGRPAVGVRWVDTSGTSPASITLHFNTLNRVRQANETEADTIVQIWNSVATAALRQQYASVTLQDGEFAGKGSGIYEGLAIKSIKVTALTGGCLNNCELEIW